MKITPAYVLAGGQSRRMGLPKAQLLVEGIPMALRVARALREGGLPRVWIVAKDENQIVPGLPLVRETEPAHHPLFGLASGLLHARRRGATLAFFSPCDLPDLRPEDVAHLLAQGQPCLARAGAIDQPLLGLLPATMAEPLLLAAQAGASVAGTLATLPRLEVSAQSLKNLNRPEDL